MVNKTKVQREKRDRRAVRRRRRRRRTMKGKPLAGKRNASRDEKRYDTYIAVVIGTH